MRLRIPGYVLAVAVATSVVCTIAGLVQLSPAQEPAPTSKPRPATIPIMGKSRPTERPNTGRRADRDDEEEIAVNQDEMVTVRISGPTEALVGQSITFRVDVQNKGTQSTKKDLSLIVHSGVVLGGGEEWPLVPDSASLEFVFDLPPKNFVPNGNWNSDFKSWEGNHLPVGSIKPDETGTFAFTMTPNRAKRVQVSVYPGVWRPGDNRQKSSLKPTARVATATVSVTYAPNTLLAHLLPQPPNGFKTRRGRRGRWLRFPNSISRSRSPRPWKARRPDCTSLWSSTGSISSIKEKPTLSWRRCDQAPDLAGLSFTLGDACRMKEGASRLACDRPGSCRPARGGQTLGGAGRTTQARIR